MTMHSFICAASLLLAGAAVADDYVTLSQRDGNRFVLGKEAAIKVGNAALVRVLTHFPASGEVAAGHHLLACDGSWMTDNFAYTSIPGDASKFAEVERHAAASMPKVIAAEHHFTLQAEDVSYDGPALKQHIGRLCAAARPAPADLLVPVGSTSAFTGQFVVFSVAARPVQVKGNRVRAWFRTTFHTQAHTPGKRPDPPVATGEYWMTLKEVDCATPQFMELEKIVHRASGTERGVCPANKTSGCPMIPVTQGSMGDAERKMACRLFGKPGLKLPL